MDSTATAAIFVGFDVGRDRLDVHLRSSGQSWRLTHDEVHLRAHLEAHVAWLEAALAGPERVVLTNGVVRAGDARQGA